MQRADKVKERSYRLRYAPLDFEGKETLAGISALSSLLYGQAGKSLPPDVLSSLRRQALLGIWTGAGRLSCAEIAFTIFLKGHKVDPMQAVDCSNILTLQRVLAKNSSARALAEDIWSRTRRISQNNLQVYGPITRARKIFNSCRWKWPSLERITSHSHDALTLFLLDAGPTRAWPDQNKFEHTLRDGLRHGEWRNAHARRRDMSGIQNGIDRETTAALHSKKDDLTEYKRACLRAIVCGGVHTAARDKLHQTKGEETGVCPFCQCDSGDSVFHRWSSNNQIHHKDTHRMMTLRTILLFSLVMVLGLPEGMLLSAKTTAAGCAPLASVRPPHIFVLGWSPQSAVGLTTTVKVCLFGPVPSMGGSGPSTGPLGFTADGSVENFKRRRQTELKHGRISAAPKHHLPVNMPRVKEDDVVRQCSPSHGVLRSIGLYVPEICCYVLCFTLAFCRMPQSYLMWFTTAVSAFVTWFFHFRRGTTCVKRMSRKIGRRRYGVNRLRRSRTVWKAARSSLRRCGSQGVHRCLCILRPVCYVWSPSALDQSREKHVLEGNGGGGKNNGRIGKGRLGKGKGATKGRLEQEPTESFEENAQNAQPSSASSEQTFEQEIMANLPSHLSQCAQTPLLANEWSVRTCLPSELNAKGGVNLVKKQEIAQVLKQVEAAPKAEAARPGGKEPVALELTFCAFKKPDSLPTDNVSLPIKSLTGKRALVNHAMPPAALKNGQTARGFVSLSNGVKHGYLPNVMVRGMETLPTITAGH
eukprot:s395_g20.t1